MHCCETMHRCSACSISSCAVQRRTLERRIGKSNCWNKNKLEDFEKSPCHKDAL